MNAIEIFTLKALRKAYTKIFGGYQLPPLKREEDPNKVSEMIYNLLTGDNPCMIARFGAFELSTMINYLGVNNPYHSVLKYIEGKQLEWWWNESLLKHLNINAGFFPTNHESVSRFCALMLSDAKQLDLLGTWTDKEKWIANELKDVQCAHLRLLEPFWADKPWTRCLKGKRIVVVHPFDKDIISQYNNHRAQLFSNPDTLPTFASLRVVKAVQSLNGASNKKFNDWFEALHWMEQEIDKEDYDVALIGCGAYGFPLGAYVKRQGKKALHLGGALQLLFGIRGKRWEDPNYGVQAWGIPYGSYSNLMNEFWIRPGKNMKPQGANVVEGGCYW